MKFINKIVFLFVLWFIIWSGNAFPQQQNHIKNSTTNLNETVKSSEDISNETSELSKQQQDDIESIILEIFSTHFQSEIDYNGKILSNESVSAQQSWLEKQFIEIFPINTNINSTEGLMTKSLFSDLNPNCPKGEKPDHKGRCRPVV